MTRFTTISADSHVIEPPNLWLDYIDPAFRQRAPHVERVKGYDVFRCEEVTLLGVGSVSGAGKPSEALSRKARYEETVPGAWDPDARLKEIEPDGVQAEVIYPSIALKMFGINDAPYQLACFQAYNRWIADFCRSNPDRFKAIGLVPAQDVETAVAETRGVRELGLSGIGIAIYPGGGRQYDDPAFDPLWAAAQEASLPISLHILTDRRPQVKMDPMDGMADQTVQADIQKTLARIILSGVFRRFPELKIVSAENDAGWAGYFLERLDYVFDRRRNYHPIELPHDIQPSDYFRRGVYLTFMRDRSGIEVRDIIGVDNLMWSSDYPHLDSTYPHSQEMIERLCGDLPEHERRKIVAENAALLYGFG